MKYNDKQENIFGSKVSNIRALIVSLDCEMITSIQKEFDKKYMILKNTLLQTVESNNIKEPSCIIFEDPNSADKVLLLFMKERFFNRVSCESASKAIKDMEILTKQEHIQEINIALSGSNLESMEQTLICKYIKTTFEKTNVVLNVFR